MAKAVKSPGHSRKTRAALSPEARENQLISLAVDLIEQRLRDGTASSQETTTLLKFASSKHRLELQILEKQKELIAAKTESLKLGSHLEELYLKAVNAMKSYSGQEEDNQNGEEEY